jgi:hypothetical protein
MHKALITARATSWEPLPSDPETRSFLGRPFFGPPLDGFLRLVLFATIGVAMANVAWIVAVYLIGE